MRSRSGRGLWRSGGAPNTSMGIRDKPLLDSQSILITLDCSARTVPASTNKERRSLHEEVQQYA
jgi:hypothetical protein